MEHIIYWWHDIRITRLWYLLLNIVCAIVFEILFKSLSHHFQGLPLIAAVIVTFFFSSLLVVTIVRGRVRDFDGNVTFWTILFSVLMALTLVMIFAAILAPSKATAFAYSSVKIVSGIASLALLFRGSSGY